MFLRKKMQKPLDYNDGFRDLNNYILSFLSTDDILKMLSRYDRSPIQDSYDLNIRRTITQYSHQLTRKWRDAIDNLIKTIVAIRKIGSEDSHVKDISLIKLKRDPDAEKSYKKACRDFDRIFRGFLKEFFSQNKLSSKKMALAKDSITHMSYSEYDIDAGYCYLTDKKTLSSYIFANSELTWHLIHTHPDLQQLSHHRNLLMDLFSGGYTPEKIHIARFLISRLSKEYVLKNIREKNNSYVPRTTIYIIYSYEREKKEKLKNYSEKELDIFERFLDEEIATAESFNDIAFIYNEHHRATYLPFTFIDDLQEKAYDILMRNSEYQPIEKCYEECQLALKHPIFSEKSARKEDVLGLLRALRETMPLCLNRYSI
jgi:hypothetical protein